MIDLSNELRGVLRFFQRNLIQETSCVVTPLGMGVKIQGAE